jgi:hypothetical protein
MDALERFPIMWNHVIEKESLNYLFGTCSSLQRRPPSGEGSEWLNKALPPT